MFRDYVITVDSIGIDAQIIADDVAEWITNDTIEKLFEGCYTGQDRADLFRVLYGVRLSKIGMYVKRVTIDWHDHTIDVRVAMR